MSNRWKILALLFCVRVTMAFQFQAAAALSPFIMQRYGVGLADIGLLIGLYLSPGIVFALPGGEVGRRFGDKRVVAFGMVLMLAGGVLVMLVPGWEAQVAGRCISGVGGVILNVLMSKMITDWFRDGDLATAMGIFVNSWPVGIAGALLVLPFIAERIGLTGTLALVTALVAIGLVLLVAYYRDAATGDAGAPACRAKLRGPALAGAVLAGSVWGLYNAALGMIFGFGPAMLVERGWSPSAASLTTSIVLWIIALTLPFGGFLADRLGRRDEVLVAGLVSFGILMWLAPGMGAIVAAFVALGFVGGIAAGPIMSLPADILAPANRAQGMGVFFTLFYIAVFVAPVIAGHLSDLLGGADAAFRFGSVMLFACLLPLWLFKATVNRVARQEVAA